MREKGKGWHRGGSWNQTSLCDRSERWSSNASSLWLAGSRCCKSTAEHQTILVGGSSLRSARKFDFEANANAYAAAQSFRRLPLAAGGAAGSQKKGEDMYYAVSRASVRPPPLPCAQLRAFAAAAVLPMVASLATYVVVCACEAEKPGLLRSTHKHIHVHFYYIHHGNIFISY